MEKAGLITLIVISIILSFLSIVHIIRRAISAPTIFIHINCLFGALIILSLSILDILRVEKVVEFTKDFSSIYFLSTSITLILSCYILLQVGINFYQDYSFIKNILMFAPIVVTMGVFSLSVLTAIRILLSEDFKLSQSEINLKNITFILSSISGLLSFIYGIIPLFSIRYQTRLRPQQTAISIVHFFIVATFFIAHFIVYAIVTFKGPILDMNYNSIQNMILILIFPGCLFAPPRSMVKFIKRRFLGVEELDIGGDYRPNMLPDNYTSRNIIFNMENYANRNIINNNNINNINNVDDDDNDITLNRKVYRLSKSLPPLPPQISSSPVTISSPTPPPRSTPNSASPRRNESPNPYSRIQIHGRSQSHTLFRSPYQFQTHKRSNTTNTVNSLNSIDSDTSFYLAKFFNYPTNDSQEPKFILDVLIAADELNFFEIIDYLQDIFLKQTQNSIQRYFTHFYDVTSQYSNFTKLRKYVKNIVTELPHIIFRADDFIGLDKETLLYLVKRVDIVIDEIEIWDCILKWCMAKSNLKNKDIKDWNIDDFYCLGKSLEPFLPHIKFEYITKQDYSIKIKPFKQSFDQNTHLEEVEESDSFDIIKKRKSREILETQLGLLQSCRHHIQEQIQIDTETRIKKSKVNELFDSMKRRNIYLLYIPIDIKKYLQNLLRENIEICVRIDVRNLLSNRGDKNDAVVYQDEDAMIIYEQSFGANGIRHNALFLNLDEMNCKIPTTFTDRWLLVKIVNIGVYLKALLMER
ncbi:BTB/POZ protein [Rhizophagus irregularis DAOM 181602=DAOM 197198]|nr:BTB/POZ protein [Rhizophagus irregularis DAOM 181602=DAOM 197198]